MANPVSDVYNSLQVARRNASRKTSGPPGSAAVQQPASPYDVPIAPNGSAGNTIGWQTTPDYNTIINNDPAMQFARLNQQGSDLDSAAARQQAIRNALIRYGKVPLFDGLNAHDPADPSGKGFLDTDVDATTRDLASQNTAAGTSILGQLGHTHDANLANLRALMASRGIFGSGQQSLMEGEEGRSYAGSLDSAQQSLFDTLQKAQQDYLGSYRSGQNTLAQDLMDTTNRLQQSGQFDPTKNSATLDSGFTAKGMPVYKDSGGNYWTADHTPVSKTDLVSTQAAAPPPPNVANGTGVRFGGQMGMQ